jgi:hypothetical protein
MKKIIRLLSSILLGLTGFGTVVFSGIMVLHANQWILYLFFGVLGLFGIALIVGAIAIARGANVSEIISDIFVSMP